MTEIKPCPFCGFRAFVATVEHPEENRYHGMIMCEQCQATAGTTGFDLTKEEAEKKAIAAWNRRSEQVYAPQLRRYVPGEDVPEGWYWAIHKTARTVVVQFDEELRTAWKYAPGKGLVAAYGPIPEPCVSEEPEVQ